MRISNMKQLLIVLIVVVAIAYPTAVWWHAFTVSQKRIEDVLPMEFSNKSDCDYIKKYLLRKVPAGEANVWLMEDFLTITFDKTILLDPPCSGGLMVDLTNTIRAREYADKVLVRIYESNSESVYARWTVRR